jgi:hypothetical protein
VNVRSVFPAAVRDRVIGIDPDRRRPAAPTAQASGGAEHPEP